MVAHERTHASDHESRYDGGAGAAASTVSSFASDSFFTVLSSVTETWKVSPGIAFLGILTCAMDPGSLTRTF